MTDELSINPRQFYDQGWNARCRNEPFDRTATIDWRDGWKDADEAPETARIIYG